MNVRHEHSLKAMHPDKNQQELRIDILDKQTDPLDLPLFLETRRTR
jgi:hypothetical protein